MRASSTPAYVVFCAFLALAPGAAAQTDASNPLALERERFGPLHVPPPAAKEGPKSSNNRARKAAQELNHELETAYKETEKTGDDTQAVAVMRRRLPELNALGASPELDARVREQISAYNRQTGNYEDSLRLSDRTLRSDPGNREALSNRGSARYYLKDYAGAMADADQLTKLDPNDPQGYLLRAMTHYGGGNYLQAAEEAGRVLAVDPNNKVAFALQRLSESRISPDMKLPSENLEQGFELQREYQGFVQQITQVEEKSRSLSADSIPKPIEKLVRNATSKISLKDYWGAIGEADRLVAEAPDYAEGYYLRAAANNLVGQYAKAAQDATQALALNPNDASSRDARAWANYRLGKFNEALADANSSLEINPRNPYAFANRGLVNEKLGDFQAMRADLEAAAALNRQFEPVLRDAVARSDIGRVPVLGQPLRPAAAARLPSDPRSARRKSFLAIITSSLAGGFLVALGLLHIMSAQWQKKITAEIRRATGAEGRSPSAIDASYEIGPMLGQGGMGVVYEGKDRALNRKVAIKMLRPELQSDARDRERFLEEARTVAALHHPSIVEIHSILEDRAGLYLVFEFIAGRSVEQLLLERKRLSLDETKAIIKHVCRALDYAHHHNVVHRDLKPSNIMITTEGAVKVMDFGIAKAAKESTGALSMTNTILGTPFYMAPEQGTGVVRKESDIFSLGACLYEMVTGERPYPAPASTPQKLQGTYIKPSQLAPLPDGLDRLVDAALQPDPDKRIRTARDFWVWLDKISGSA